MSPFPGISCQPDHPPVTLSYLHLPFSPSITLSRHPTPSTSAALPFCNPRSISYLFLGSSITLYWHLTRSASTALLIANLRLSHSNLWSASHPFPASHVSLKRQMPSSLTKHDHRCLIRLYSEHWTISLKLRFHWELDLVFPSSLCVFLAPHCGNVRRPRGSPPLLPALTYLPGS